ncbi:MAG: hypothetical protein LBP20_10820 [Treponema sp.]|jgi:hypothetical protein|nr:hypothetical protein [Treponema sp.]
MDLEKIQVRLDLERMVNNYFITGKLSPEEACCITSYLNGVIGGGQFPKPEAKGNIIYFPGAWQGSKPQEPPKTPEQRNLSVDAPREWFKDVTLGNYYHTRIMWALYDLDIRSLEDLARTPINELLKHRNIGRKTIEYIRAVLESRGFVPGKDWNMVTGEKGRDLQGNA